MKAEYVDEFYEKPPFNSLLYLIDKQRKYQEHLYEGLIKSYSVKDTVRYFVNSIKKKEIKGITYGYIKEVNNSALPYIVVTFKSYFYTNEIGEWIISLFKVCGWELADILNRENQSIMGNKIHENDSYRLVFRAKFDVEISRDKWPEFLYHLSPASKKHKILKNGLVPRSENKQLKHKDAVYLFKANDEEDLIYLAKQLKNKSIKKENTYSIFRINTKKFPKFFKLFIDPDLIESFFTKDNITKYNIEFIKDINV